MTTYKDKDFELIAKIAKFEAETPREQYSLGWSWKQVAIYPGNITRLIALGLVKITYDSHYHTNYLLTDKGRDLAATGAVPPERASREVPEIPPDLFDDIVGYDDVKELLMGSLSLEKPIHVLLYGPPALAKSMFLRVVEGLGGPLAMWTTGSATSQTGLWDALAARMPRWLLVDEIEKMNLTDMSGLLSLMETGRLVRTKVGRELDEQLTIWVIAAANRIRDLPDELLSRFAVVEVKPYTGGEFVEVVRKVLVRWEGLDEEHAADVGAKLVGRTQDVRDAVRVARLSTKVGVQRAIELLFRG